MNFHIITLFPTVCQAYTDASVLGRAQKTDKGMGAKVRGKKISVSYYNPRDFSQNKHNKVDDKPYGGGPGMVMKAEPILRAWQKAVGRKKDQKKVKTLIMSPRGTVFTQALAKEYANKYDHLVLISGRYEGIDARVQTALKAEEVSVGDYILTGGELPALTIVDSVSRQIEGVLGTNESLEDDRATTGETYTRPDVFEWKKKKYKVPEVFINGNHAEIDKRRAGKKSTLSEYGTN
jgi:tRNA (guanine37-N1)-methyltransferase